MNTFLKFRKWLENDSSNTVKNATDNDLFDWINLFVLFGGGSAFLFMLWWGHTLELKDAIQVLVLWFTAFVIVRYTKETYFLKKLAQKQNITSIRPYLRLQKKGGENKLQLVNEGKGVAVNLRSIYKKGDQKIPLPGITAMAAAPGSFTEGLTPTRLGIDFDSDADCSIDIDYEDIEGRKYYVIFRRNAEYNDKFEIIEQRER